jgi:hypothetical protein
MLKKYVSTHLIFGKGMWHLGDPTEALREAVKFSTS